MKLEAEDLEDYKKMTAENEDDVAELKPENNEEKAKEEEESVIEEDKKEKSYAKKEIKEKNDGDDTKKVEIKKDNKEKVDIKKDRKEETKSKKENFKDLTKTTEKTEKLKKKEPFTRKMKFSDDESSDSEFNSDNFDSESDYMGSDDDGIANSDYNEDSNDGEDNKDKIDLENVYVYSKSNLTYNSTENAKNLKPLVFENKPAHMVIKQINLDEIKDCSEIPIEPVGKASESDEEEIKEKRKASRSEFDEERISTIKIEQDPFFLDKDGNEVRNERLDRINSSSFRARPRHHDYDDDNLMSYSSYDKFKNKDEFRNKRNNLTSSSFRSSLSSDYYPSRFDRPNRYDNSNRDFKRKFNDEDNDYKRQRPMDDGGNGKFEKRGFENRNTSFNSKFRSNGANYNNDDKPAVDVSKLHPSWQAKKLMEDKLKSLKFEGKKVKFDDDD